VWAAARNAQLPVLLEGRMSLDEEVKDISAEEGIAERYGGKP
jgi:hypothetical protein